MGVIVGLNSRWAWESYERNKQAEVIQICVTRDSLNFVYDMSVEDAETLVNDLTDWIREVKPYSELHDADEEVLPEAIDPTELPSVAGAVKGLGVPMNKLTEIKQALKEATPGPWEKWEDAVRNPRGKTSDDKFICQMFDNNIQDYHNTPANIHLIANTPEYITYLISLLEEKNKALRKIIEHYNSDGTDTLIAIKMLGEAQNALNTSSNNEGDK